MNDETPKNIPEAALLLDNHLERAATALAEPGTPSSDLHRLMDEADSMRQALEAEADKEREKLLAATLPRAELQEAKAAAEAAELDLRRLKATIEKLESRWTAQIERERAERHLAEHRNLDRECEELAREILEDGVAAIETLRDLNSRIVETDEKCRRMNANLPASCEPLNRPEGRARGFLDLEDGMPKSLATFWLTEAMLPDLHDETFAAWPPVHVGNFIRGQDKGFKRGEVRGIVRKATARRQ